MENNNEEKSVEFYQERQKKYKPLDLFFKFPFGQYEGQVIKDICDRDPEYIIYLMKGGTKFTKSVRDLVTINKRVKDRNKYRGRY